jgi:hypothetical protein
MVENDDDDGNKPEAVQDLYPIFTHLAENGIKFFSGKDPHDQKNDPYQGQQYTPPP